MLFLKQKKRKASKMQPYRRDIEKRIIGRELCLYLEEKEEEIIEKIKALQEPCETYFPYENMDEDGYPSVKDTFLLEQLFGDDFNADY